MHEFHPYNPELPQIITSFKGNQKLILGGFRYNIHHVKEGVKTWRCVCAKKLTGSRSWCKGRAETWDNDSKGIPKGEHNHSTEHELAELEYFKSQMILAAISEPAADLSTLIDEAAKFLSEGLNFGNRESMKKSLLVARKSVESGEFSLGKHRTVSVGGHPRSSASSTGKKKGGGTAAQQNAKMAMASEATHKGTVANKSQVQVPVSSFLSVSGLPMPSSSSSSSKFPSPSSFKRSAGASSDGTAASFDTSGASCSNTSGYGTLSSSSGGFVDDESAVQGIGWMDLSGENGNFMMPTEKLGQTNMALTMNGGANSANLLEVEGHSASSADQQHLFTAALIAAAMLGNPSAMPTTTSVVSSALSPSLTSTNNNNSSTIGTVMPPQHTIGDVMLSMITSSNVNTFTTNNNNNKATKRGSARSAAAATAAVGAGAVQAKQQGPASATVGLANSRNSMISARKKTARVNCILNKLSTKAAEKSVSPSPSHNNSEPCSIVAKASHSPLSADANGVVPAHQCEKHLVTVATQTDQDTVVNDEDGLKATRKRKSDENALFGREQQQNGNNDKEGTEKRKVVCCCCCDDSELNEWEMPMECKRRVLKTEQNGTTAEQQGQQMPKMDPEGEDEIGERESDLEEEMFDGIDHGIKLEIAEEDEE